MFTPLVSVRMPARGLRAREHRRVFARTVVVETRQPRTRLTQQLEPARRQRVVRTTGEIALFEADVAQHLLREGDVLRLTTVRRARERKLVVAPMQLVEGARLQERHDLEWLGAGSPGAHEPRVVRDGDDRVVVSDDDRVHAVPRFDFRASGGDDVKLERFHSVSARPRWLESECPETGPLPDRWDET